MEMRGSGLTRLFSRMWGEDGEILCDGQARGPDAAAPLTIVSATSPPPTPRGERAADADACRAVILPEAKALADIGTPVYAATIDPAVNLTATPVDGVGVSYADTFRLHSNPGSTYKVFLDFDGHTTSGTVWNTSQASFTSAAFTLDGSENFSSDELARIQSIWQRIAEVFSPFNIDVTTEDPGPAGLSRSDPADASFGIRVVIKSDTSGTSGSAQLGSFDWDSDTPAFVNATTLSGDPAMIAAAIAHEVGHSLGLSHDGQWTSSYYYGHGSGTTSWAPVMGAGYYANVLQWSSGGYAGATNLEDDLAIITSQNSGVALRADDHGNTFAAATALGGTVSNGVATVQAFGVISGSGAANDVDMFAFQLAPGGSVTLSIAASTAVHVAGAGAPTYDASPFTMLDVKAVLLDASGRVVFTADDPATLGATISLTNLVGGTYYLAVDGTGWGYPFDTTALTGWTDYGSLGQYMISGSYGAAASVPLPAGYLALDRSALRTDEMGTAASFTLRAFNVSSSVTVQLAGLDATEGATDTGSVTLDAENNWTTSLSVIGRNDAALDGDIAYTLAFTAANLTGASLTVTNADNDHGVASIGSAAGSYKKQPMVGNASLAALSADDGSAITISEGTSGGSQRLEWRWEVKELVAGDHTVHLDAASNGEAFRFEYSVDGTNWQSFAGRSAAAASWSGDFAVTTASAGSLWIRALDAIISGDQRRDTLSVDYLVVETIHAGASGVAAAAPAWDWPLG